MQIRVQQISGRELALAACESTTGGKDTSKVSFPHLYAAEHSPIRCITFFIELIDIPTFVSVHLVRHKIGVEHFVQSMREDRPGVTEVANRHTSIRHSMFINAQALITMSRKRLCHKASVETRGVMRAIQVEIMNIDVDLYKAMRPECRYRGFCPEQNSCGYYNRWLANS